MPDLPVVKQQTPALRLPTAKQRVAVLGRTGSGKTTFGAWLLSEAPFTRQPFIIIDYKGEEIFANIDRIKEIGLTDRIPRKPGLYVVRPVYGQDDEVEEFLWRLWKQEHTGLFVDEAYMLPNKRAFNAILTQGRSKYIPAIVLSQRPVKISKFVYSEADYFSVFYFNNKSDEDIVSDFVPMDFDEKLLDHHSVWYDVARNRLSHLAPCPPAGEIEEYINDRLQPQRRVYL